MRCALGSDCEIHTVDKNRDRFIVHEGFERIIRYPNTESMEFWKNGMDGFDFVFVDGWLNLTLSIVKIIILRL